MLRLPLLYIDQWRLYADIIIIIGGYLCFFILIMFCLLYPHSHSVFKIFDFSKGSWGVSAFREVSLKILE